MLKKRSIYFSLAFIITLPFSITSFAGAEAKIGYYYSNYALANSSLLKGAVKYEHDNKTTSLFVNTGFIYGYSSNYDITSYRLDSGFDIIFWNKFGILLYTEEKRAVCESIYLRAKNGAGIKYYFMRDEKTNQDKWSLSLMGIYDYTDFTVDNDLSIIRLSFRNKLQIKITDHIKFFSIEYYQPAIKDFNDYIIKTENGIQFVENIFFIEVKLVYNYESRRLYFQKDEIVLETGLGVKF